MRERSKRKEREGKKKRGRGVLCAYNIHIYTRVHIYMYTHFYISTPYPPMSTMVPPMYTADILSLAAQLA